MKKKISKQIIKALIKTFSICVNDYKNSTWELNYFKGPIKKPIGYTLHLKSFFSFSLVKKSFKCIQSELTLLPK